MSEKILGSVVSIWRYPVKSMLGEELNAATVTERGVLGDRSHALIDRTNGKVISAKHPRKWGKMFDCRAAFVETPQVGQALPAIKLTLPDGAETTTSQVELEQILANAFGQSVGLISSSNGHAASYEYLWPSIEGLPHQNEVTDFEVAANSFFDDSTLHLLTTSSLDQLQVLRAAQASADMVSRFDARRFRPNFVIQSANGQTGFVENDWVGGTVAIGDELQIQINKPCGRCVMTTMPQAELPQDLEILRTAMKHNQGNVGVYASVVQSGSVKRGDLVRLIQ